MEEGKEQGGNACIENIGVKSGRRMDVFVIMSAVLIGLAGYLGTMLTVSLPAISSQYGVPISETSLILALYAVTGIASVPLI